jgi:seryl-tRNA synthetase
MKGKIMTTENTTQVTPELPPLTPEQVAEEFVKENTTATIIEEFVNHYNAIESLKQQLEYQQQETRNQRSRWASMAETIEEFLKEHIAEGHVDTDDLKQLAEDLEIELTKTITVKFTAEVEVEITVPIDADVDDVDENDFTVSAEFDGKTDWEVNDTNINVNDFDVEEE